MYSEILELDRRQILDRTGEAWGEIRGGRIFITGGTGFFGSWLLDSFIYANRSLKLDATAVVLSRDPSVFRSRVPYLAYAPEISLIPGDLENFQFPEGSFTHLIHAASELRTDQPTNPLATLRTGHIGAERVATFASKSGVRKMLLTSSGAVYGAGSISKGPVKEHDPISALPLGPGSVYAQSKRTAELIFAILGNEGSIEAKIARGFAFVGPYLSLSSPLAAARFLSSVLKGERIVIEGHGKTVRSYLYGADLAAWLWTILFRGTAKRPYNLGSDVEVTISELADTIALESGSNIAPEIRGKLNPGDSVDYYVPDISRAREELGLDVFTPFGEAIKRTLRFHTN